MPGRYWEQVNDAETLLHLQTVHAFFEGLTAGETEGTSPVVRWRHLPDRGVTEVLVSTWDRHGLLVKVAGAFALVRINIVRAVVYTRSDDVVLDIFEVGDPQTGPIRDESRLHKMASLLEASVGQPLTVSFVATRSLPKQDPPALAEVGREGCEAAIRFEDESSADGTVLRIDADDRLGLLYEILLVLTECGINISQAILDTRDGVARDVFHVTEKAGGKILDPARLMHLRTRLARAVAG